MGRTGIYLAHENKHYVVTVKDFREKTLFIEDFDRKISQYINVSELQGYNSSLISHRSSLITVNCQLTFQPNLFTTFAQQLIVYAD